MKTSLLTKLSLLVLCVITFAMTSCEDNFDDLPQPESNSASPAIGQGIIITPKTNYGFRGVVLEKISPGVYGDPIVGAKIRFTKEDGTVVKWVFTNSSGRYKISLPTGRYYVVATHPDHEIYNSAPGFFVVNGTGYQTGNIFIEKTDYGRQGFAYERYWNGSIGPKLGNVKLTFAKDDGLFTKTVYSSSTGYFKASLPAGKYYVKAEKSGYFTYDSTPGVAVVSASGGYSTLNTFQKKILIAVPIN